MVGSDVYFYLYAMNYEKGKNYSQTKDFSSLYLPFFTYYMLNQSINLPPHNHSSNHLKIPPFTTLHHQPVYRFLTLSGGSVVMMSGRRFKCSSIVVLLSAKNVSCRNEACAASPCFCAARTQCRR